MFSTNQSIHFPFLFNFIVAIFNLSFHLSSNQCPIPVLICCNQTPFSSHIWLQSFPFARLSAIVLSFCSVLQFNDGRSGFFFANPSCSVVIRGLFSLQSLSLPSFPNFPCQFSVCCYLAISVSSRFAVSLPLHCSDNQLPCSLRLPLYFPLPLPAIDSPSQSVSLQASVSTFTWFYSVTKQPCFPSSS